MLKLGHALISIALLIIVALVPSYAHDTLAVQSGEETHTRPNWREDPNNPDWHYHYYEPDGKRGWDGILVQTWIDDLEDEVDGGNYEPERRPERPDIVAIDGTLTDDEREMLEMDIEDDPNFDPLNPVYPDYTAIHPQARPLNPFFYPAEHHVEIPQSPIGLPDKVNPTTTYTGIVVIPIASDTADSEVISEVVSGRGSATQPPPKLTITHIETYYRPYYIIVYVLNDSGRFASTNNMRVIMLDGEGNQKQSIALPRRDGSFTYQDVNCRKHKSYISPDEVCTNNAFVVASAVAYKNWDYRKHTERFKVRAKFRFGSKSNRYNPDSDIIKLVWIRDGEAIVIAMFPDLEVEVAAAPRAPMRKATITWAEIKKRN